MGTNVGWAGWLANIPTGGGAASKAKGKGCMELGRGPGGPGWAGWMVGAPVMLGADIVGMDMEGRDIGGPDTGGPGIRGMDMGVRGIGAWLERAEGPDMRGLDKVARGRRTVDTGATDMAT